MIELLVVGVGGFLGAVARYGLTSLVHRLHQGAFPWGTFVVNVLGCFALGVLITWVENRDQFHAGTRLFLTIGLLGSFTTFSTLGYETFAVMRDRNFGMALNIVLANVALGVLAVGLGRALFLSVRA